MTSMIAEESTVAYSVPIRNLNLNTISAAIIRGMLIKMIHTPVPMGTSVLRMMERPETPPGASWLGSRNTAMATP